MGRFSRSSLAFALLALLCLCSTNVSGLKFALQSAVGEGKTKCVEQYLYTGTMVILQVKIAGDLNTQELSLRVTESHTESLAYSGKKMGESHQGTFRTHHDGYTSYCFTNKYQGTGSQPEVMPHLQVSLFVDAGHFSRLEHHETPDNDFDKIEESLKKLSKDAASTEQQVTELRKEEISLTKKMNRLFSRFKIISFLLLLVSVGSGVWQYLELKKFFRLKKLL